MVTLSHPHDSSERPDAVANAKPCSCCRPPPQSRKRLAFDASSVVCACGVWCLRPGAATLTAFMLMPAASSPTDTPPAPPAACQSSLGSFALNHHSEPWDRNSALEMKGNSRRDLKWRKVTQSESRSIAPSNMAAHIQKILRDHSASSHLFCSPFYLATPFLTQLTVHVSAKTVRISYK